MRSGAGRWADKTIRSFDCQPFYFRVTETISKRFSPSYVHAADLPATLRSGWQRGVVVSGVRMNEVNARRARLVLGWVTAFGRVYHLGM